MPQTLADRLRERMDARGLKAGPVADQAGLGRSFVYDIMLGRSANPTTEKLGRVAKVLQTNVEYLLYGTPPGVRQPRVRGGGRTVAVPFVKIEAAMGGAAVVEDEEHGEPWHFHKDWIRNSLLCRPSDLRLIRVKGDSMEPTLLAGDIVMTDFGQTAPSPAGVFVLDDGFGLVAKRLEYIPNSDPPTVKVISDNDRYDTYERTSDEVHIVGRIVWFARQF